MDSNIREYGLVRCKTFVVMCIVGEIEGHDNLNRDSKTTKYEHILPLLAEIEEDEAIKGVLFIVNTIGGDVSCGLAIAEMIAGMHKKTVSFVIGDSHSIGVPIAVSADYSFIVPSATVIIHPVRMNGTVLGVSQTYRQFDSIQERIVSFVAKHSKCSRENILEMMMDTRMMAKDLGTILVGQKAVECGIIDAVGDIHSAVNKLKELIGQEKPGTC